MRVQSAFLLVKIGLAILVAASLNFTIAKTDAHAIEASGGVFEKIAFATNPVDSDQRNLKLVYDKDGEVAHGLGDCHIHILGQNEAKLICVRSTKDQSQQWLADSVVIAPLQNFFRPPRT